jgi:predicted transcriptional regulator
MKDKRGLGSALRRMMGAPPVHERDRIAVADSVLMNSKRLSIFQELCNHPCSHVRALSREIGIAPPSVLWHLDKLLGRGVVKKARSGNRSVFYPAGLLEAEDVELLAVLDRHRRGPVLRAVLDRPGITQGALARAVGANSHTINALVDRGALEMVRDGRNRRYYPGLMLRNRREFYERRARRFKQVVLSLLAGDGLAPETGRYERDILDVRVTVGTQVKNLRLLCNPFAFGARE